MSWLDSVRGSEPAGDPELRAELRDLLGLGPVSPHTPAPSLELKALADDLLREAQRRRRTDRQRSSWVLLAAAAFPFALGLVGLGTWGVRQKQRADALAENVRHQEVELSRITQASHAELTRERRAREEVQKQLQWASMRPTPKKAEPYLVIPVEKPLGLPAREYQTVKQKPE